MEKEFDTPPEEKLFKEFLAWMENTKRLYRDFEREGVPIPKTLIRVLINSDQNSQKKSVRKTRLRRPEEPDRPTRAGDDWIWIEAKEASLRTIVLSILNEGKTIPIKELISRVRGILPDPNEGSIYNLAGQEEKIQKTDQGWKLAENIEAPILNGKYIWGTPTVLQKQDVAAFRRMVIRYLLETSPDGLQIMQVVRQLEGAEWLKDVPLSKDLIKADLFLMKKEKRARQIGNTKKWTLIKSSDKEKDNAPKLLS